jgi:hypothetical protein
LLNQRKLKVGLADLTINHWQITSYQSLNKTI